MKRQVYADNVDLNGKVFETVGENIRKGAREIDSQCVTPESFGAVGDGVTDDTEALKKAINHAIKTNKELKPISSDKTYLVTEKLVINGTIKINFQNACIKSSHAGHVIEVYVSSDGTTGIDGYIRNIVINCNNIGDSGLYIRSSHRWNYNNITIKNAVSIALYTNACQDCRFNNIYILIQRIGG